MWAYTDDENGWLDLKHIRPEPKSRSMNDNHPDPVPQLRCTTGPRADPAATFATPVPPLPVG